MPAADSTFMLNLYQMGRNFLSIKFLQYKDSYLGFDVEEFYRNPSAILTCMITGLMCLLQKYLIVLSPSSTVALYCLNPKFTFDLQNQTIILQLTIVRPSLKIFRTGQPL